MTTCTYSNRMTPWERVVATVVALVLAACIIGTLYLIIGTYAPQAQAVAPATTEAPTTVHNQAEPGRTVYVPEDYPGTWNADHGDFVILIMTPGSDQGSEADFTLMVARCNQYGGEFIYNPYTRISTCEGVDF